MKKIFYILIFLSVLVSCKDNFDELKDTDQRYISFEIYTEDFFDDFFYLPTNDMTQGKEKYELDSDHKIRLSCYCYDDANNLVGSSSILVNELNQSTLKIFHLIKDREYRFEIFADIVKFDKAVDYYESWFHLEYSSIDSFYIINLLTDEIPQHNILRHITVNATPENNIVPVKLDPITINSYCILSNIEYVEWVSGKISCSMSIFIESMKARSKKSLEFSYINKGQKKIIIPFTTLSIQDTVMMQLTRVMLNNTDKIDIPIINQGKRPFVTDIDCKSLTLTSCVFYEK